MASLVERVERLERMSETNDTLIDDADALDVEAVDAAMRDPDGVPDGYVCVGRDKRGMVYQRVDEMVVPVPPEELPERIPKPEIRPAARVSLKWDAADKHSPIVGIDSRVKRVNVKREERKRAKLVKRCEKAIPSGITLDTDSKYEVGKLLSSNSKYKFAAGGTAGIVIAVGVVLVLWFSGTLTKRETRTEYLSAPNHSAELLESWLAGDQRGSLLPDEIKAAQRAVDQDRKEAGQ